MVGKVKAIGRRTKGWIAAMAAVAACGIALVGAGGALAHPLTPGGGLANSLTPWVATVEVYDRHDGQVLAEHEKDGRRYVVGTPGHEYVLRVRNLTGERILAVMSVDGVNVVTGETASPEQSGYVIDPFGSVDVTGWRKSLSRTAAFYFTDLGDSYAARTGRPDNVGVIGLAVFRERARPVALHPIEKIARAEAPARDSAPATPPVAQGESRDGPLAPLAAAPAQEATGARNEAALDAAQGRNEVAAEGRLASKAMRSPLGTGHGRDESSYATQVRFDRASTSPAQTVAIRYDRRENLVALGVLPGPRYAERAPRPFPGDMRFAPDPR